MFRKDSTLLETCKKLRLVENSHDSCLKYNRDSDISSSREYHNDSLEKTQIGKSGNFYYIASIIPVIFLTYLQLAFNLIMVSLVVNSTFKFISILESDLDKHIDTQSNVLFSQIISCSREYVKNGCALSMAPALEEMCDKWKLCMEQDTSNILKSKESAIIFAEILNNFFGSLTDRTMYCTGSMLFGSIIIANFALNWSRRKL